MRIIWIQLLKRSPLKLRKLLRVPKGHNSKGVALFLSGYCNLYHIAQQGNYTYGSQEDILKKIIELGDLLLKLSNKEFKGHSWGYNFDWQSRAFFLPNKTPTVVATSFAVESLFLAYEITKKQEYFNAAISSAEFVKYSLNRIPKEDELFMFSYSPLDNRAVYNATLLGSKILSQVYHYTNDEELKSLARKSVEAVCNKQNDDGSFPHSDQVGDSWRDSFHTAFKLESISFYQKYCDDLSFQKNLDAGVDYWLKNYFDFQTGFCYYYDRGVNSTLVDLHCVSQAITTLHKLEIFESNSFLADKITSWAINNMQDKRGYFYFQMKQGKKNKNIYMRWPNAWMFYGLSYYLLNTHEDDKA